MNHILTPEEWLEYYPIFKPSEFYCKCGCGLLNVTKRHMDMLFAVRIAVGMPFLVRSGCRCPAHNKNAGGSGQSDHLFGEGTDIHTGNSGARFQILKGLIKGDFRRIGIGRTFLHAGTYLGNAQEVVWLY